MGFLPLTLAEPLRLLDGRRQKLRGDKCGAVLADLAPVLQHWHVVGKAQVDPAQHSGHWHHRVVGRATTLSHAAHRWLHGKTHHRQAFR